MARHFGYWHSDDLCHIHQNGVETQVDQIPSVPPRLSNGVLACHELSIPPRCNNQIYRSEFDITKCMVHKGTEVKPSYLIFVSLSFFLSFKNSKYKRPSYARHSNSRMMLLNKSIVSFSPHFGISWRSTFFCFLFV